jgi:hypothetical protein
MNADDIKQCSMDYAEILKSYDISAILELIQRYYTSRKKSNIIVMKYPGIFEVPIKFDSFSEEKKKITIQKVINKTLTRQEKESGTNLEKEIKQNENKNQICIIAVTLGHGGDHYMGLLKIKNQVFIWDSASTNAIDDKHEIYYIAESLYPTCKLLPVETDHIFQPAGGGSDDVVISQNIFCHTWTLWFFHLIFCMNDPVKLINKIKTIDNSNQEQNLCHIKQYAKFICRYFDEPEIEKIQNGLLKYINPKNKIEPTTKYKMYFYECIFK